MCKIKCQFNMAENLGLKQKKSGQHKRHMGERLRWVIRHILHISLVFLLKLWVFNDLRIAVFTTCL